MPITPRHMLRPPALLSVAVLVAAVSCSSPTAPTPRPTPTPTPPPPLTISCPAGVSATATSNAGTSVSFTPPVATGGVAPVQASCTPASASMFPVGSTTVRCTATDAAQATTSCTFAVTVSVLPAPPELTRVRFLAFGDSMTAGEVFQSTVARTRGGLPNVRLIVIPSASYPTQLLTQLRARYAAQQAQIDMTNSGISGEWAQDGARRLPGVMATVRPEVVLLLEGINDIFALGAPGIQRAASGIDMMAREVRNRGARLFLATVPPPASNRANVVPVAYVESLNTMIRATARGENAVLVDLYQALSSDVNRYIGGDGLHPTEAGYQRIAETFFAAIRADLERR